MKKKKKKIPKYGQGCVRRLETTYASLMHAYASTRLYTQVRWQKP